MKAQLDERSAKSNLHDIVEASTKNDYDGLMNQLQSETSEKTYNSRDSATSASRLYD